MKLAALACLLAAACATHDPRSGAPAGKLLLALDADEVATLCAFIAERDPPRNLICGDRTVPFGTTAEMCIQNFVRTRQFPSCPATVQDAERCFIDLGALADADACALPATVPTTCAALLGPQCD